MIILLKSHFPQPFAGISVKILKMYPFDIVSFFQNQITFCPKPSKNIVNDLFFWNRTAK